ncbi:MAG: hypothetical protein KBC57_06010 [Neisseriaceae bacterium]|nr:hypothetical protein [Neisseriaceae bacterium]MBP6861894.1 hypothetical protein [Neisseriaceae bacterium]
MRSWLLALAVMGCAPMAAESTDSVPAMVATDSSVTEALPATPVVDRPVPSDSERASPPEAEASGVLDDAAVESTVVSAQQPADVVEFIEARDTCGHFMGEFVGDPAIDEPRGINQQIEAACQGLDERLAALKALHQHDAAIMAVLNEYEPLY